MHNDKDLSTWQTFRRLWPTIAPFKAGLIVAGVALILNAASDTFMLSLLKPLLDDGFGKTDRSVLMWMPLVVIGLMILRGITSYISSYCISWVSGKVVMTMRRRLFGHMMGMPVSFFDKQSTGTLLSRITYDSEQVASSSSGALITVVREGASIIGLFIIVTSLARATFHYIRTFFFHERFDFHHEMSSGLTTALEFLMSAEIAKTFLLQNLESVVPLAATFALRALMSLLLHIEMRGAHKE